MSRDWTYRDEDARFDHLKREEASRANYERKRNKSLSNVSSVLSDEELDEMREEDRLSREGE